MPTTANTINYYIAADGTLRDGQQGSIPQTPRINYGTNYAVTLFFPPSTIAEGDQLQVALNRTRTFFSSASSTGDAPVAAVAKHDVTAAEADAQAVTLTLSTNTRAMIDQVNGIDHPVRGFFGVHVLRGQSFVTLAVADALMMSLESGPDAISPSLPVVDYPTREEAVALVERSEVAAGRAETAQGKAEEAQGKAETAEDNAQIWAEGTDQQVEELGGGHSAKEYDRLAGVSATNAGQSAINAGQSATDAGNAKTAAQTAQSAAETAQANAGKIAEGSDVDVAPFGLEHSAKGWADEAAATLASKRDILQTLVTSSSTALVVEAGKSYNWTVSAASTIALAAADKVAGKETRIDIYIDLQDGGSVSGDGVTISDAVLQSGWYKLIWDGTNATLYSTKAGGAESVITIPAATTSYALQDNKHYQQVPSSVPTYTLPTASFDGLVHEITVLVDFMHVTSCSFVDASGVPVTLQSAISPQIGEAYIFRCYWYGKWRVVSLKIRNAATASSATGVVEVSDAVAGNALAMKMVAPRSVVVNQLVQNGDFSDGTTGWAVYGGSNYGSLTTNNNELTIISTNNDGAKQVYTTFAQPLTLNHSYLFKVEVKNVTLTASDARAQIRLAYKDTIAGSSNIVTTEPLSSVSTSAFSTITGIGVVTSNANVFDIILGGQYSYQSGDSCVIRNVQLVDLTQYFNGDQTLIDSITSWADLVAYDPRFASYVEHNTGEVAGVQPTVKVSGKNLLDISAGGPSTSQKTIYSQTGMLLPLGQYRISAVMWNLVDNNSMMSINFVTQDSTGVTLERATIINYVKGSTKQTTISSVNITKPYSSMFVYIGSSVGNSAIYWENVQLELGSTATSYEPYHDGGTAQAPVPLYGVGNAADEYEAVSGVTTHNVQQTSNVENLGWTKGNRNRDDTGYCFYVRYFTGSYTGELLLVGYPFATFTNGWENMKVNTIGRQADYIIVCADYDSLNAFKTALTGRKIYFEVATPTTSQSTPAQISLQAGSNVAMQTDGGRTLAELALTYENLPA